MLLNSYSSRAVISVSAATDNLVVAAVTGKSILVVDYVFLSAGTVVATWKSNTTAISGAMPLAINTGAVCPYNPFGWFQTAPGENLNLALGSAIAVTGHLSYVLLG